MEYETYMKCIISEQLGVKSDKYKFIRYPKETIMYYFLHLLSEMFISKHVTFLEKKKLFLKGAVGEK